MNNSIATVSFMADRFAKLLANIAFEIPFEPEWKNGTGYFDHAVDCYVPEGRVVKAVCPSTQRRIVLVGTVLGTVVVFERYTPDIGQAFILTWHAPKALRAFIGEPALTSDTLEKIVCTYHPQENISKHVDRLIDDGVKARIARKVDVASTHTPAPEKGVTCRVVPDDEISTHTGALVFIDSGVSSVFTAVAKAVHAAKGVVQDDHRASIGGTLKLCGVATLDKDGSSIPVALIDDDYFSLNELYLDEAGVPHVSTRAVAGVIHTPKSQNVTLEQGIAAYNKAMEGNRFSCGSINNVVLF